MMARRTQKQDLKRRIEAEMYDNTRTEYAPGYDPDGFEHWRNYQEYLEAQRRKDYEKALVAAYETGEIDPGMYDLLIW